MPVVPGAGLAMAEEPPKRYRLIGIDAPPSLGDVTTIAYDINCKGEVVGHVFGGSTRRGLLWLPSGAYGLASGSHQLLATPGGPSEARSINDVGRVAGFRRPSFFTEQLVLWDVPGHTIGDIVGDDVHEIATLTGDRVSINNADTFAATGTLSGFSRAFRLSWDAVIGPGATQWLDPPDFWLQSLAGPIGNSGLVAGDHATLDEDAAGRTLCPELLCSPWFYWARHGNYWPPSTTSAGELSALGFVDPTLCPELQPLWRDVQSINSDDVMAGRAWSDPINHCMTVATVWTAPTNPVVLPLPAGHLEDHATTANAVSDPTGDGYVYVVGENAFLRRAIVWRAPENQLANSSAWEADDLADIADLRDTEFAFLREATGVNVMGRITGWGELQSAFPPGEFRAFVAIPLDGPNACPADINLDGVVNVFDLLDLLGAWGTCPEELPCWADLTNDGAVTVFDLLELLGQWGPCPGHCDPPSVDPIEDELAAVGITMNSWEDFLDVLENGTALESERWRCWLERRLTQCQTCRTCRGSDPFAY